MTTPRSVQKGYASYSSSSVLYPILSSYNYNHMYFNYYASQALYHTGGKGWERWNSRMREYLVNSQATAGHEAGSWYFQDQHGQVGGRLYTTAMAVMILEVYYRFLPLYEDKAIEAQNQGAKVLR